MKTGKRITIIRTAGMTTPQKQVDASMEKYANLLKSRDAHTRREACDYLVFAGGRKIVYLKK